MRIRNALAMFAVALAAATPVPAQTEAEVNKIIEMVRVNVKRDKTAAIGLAMGFTGEEAAKFWPIYKDYEAELTKLGDERLALIKDYAASFQTMTDSKAAELAARALDQDRFRLDLKTKYHMRLSKEMSPVIAARFVQVENRLNAILDLKLASEIPLVQKAGF